MSDAATPQAAEASEAPDMSGESLALEGQGGDIEFPLDTDFEDESFVAESDEGKGEEQKVEEPKQSVEPAKAAPAAPPAPKLEAKEPEPQKPEPQVETPPQEGSEQSFVERLAANRDALVEALSQERFALTKEEVEQFDVNPAQAASKLAARAYFEAVTAAINHINNMVPQIVQTREVLNRRFKEAEDAFYGKFPNLDRAKHDGDVAAFAKVFRGSNPQISQDDLYALVGAAVMAKHGLTAQAVAAQTNGQSAPKPKPVPFVPAQPGAVVRATPEPSTPWDGMGQDFDDA